MEQALIINDVHLPFHDKTTWRLFCQAVKKLQPGYVIFNGDILDMHNASRYPKSRGGNQLLKKEIAKANKILDRFASMLPPHTEVHWTKGNHEARVEKRIMEELPEFEGLCTLTSLLKIEERGWHWHNEAVKIGNTWFTHTTGRTGKNASAQSLDDYGANIAVGHGHGAGLVFRNTVEGQIQFGMSNGYAADPTAEAMNYRETRRARREWTHCIGSVDIAPDGTCWPHIHPIIGRRVAIRGQLFKV